MSNQYPVVPKFLGCPLFCLYLQVFMYEVGKYRLTAKGGNILQALDLE